MVACQWTAVGACRGGSARRAMHVANHLHAPLQHMPLPMLTTCPVHVSYDIMQLREDFAQELKKLQEVEAQSQKKKR